VGQLMSKHMVSVLRLTGSSLETGVTFLVSLVTGSSHYFARNRSANLNIFLVRWSEYGKYYSSSSTTN